jgi:hypothetical protein
MIFLDGVGIGKRDPAVNPFFVAHLPALRSMLDGEIPSLHHRRILARKGGVIPLDATLGVAGLPQSGTGQTALFTGINAPALIGKHFGPYPYSTLRPVVERDNIFRRLLDAGKHPYFANAFPQRFFDFAEQKRTRLTVTTQACLFSGVKLLRAEDLARGAGVSADITNHGWHALGYPDMKIISPTEAGHRLARLTRHHDFVLYEYWKTDHAGHARSFTEAVDAIEKLDAMIVGILEGLDSTDTVLLISSDHGNLEDLSVKTHTRNPVPAIVYGHRHASIIERLEHRSFPPSDLCQVTPTLLEFLSPGS